MIKKMTAIRLAADKEKQQMHESPLFPCSAYVTDWRKGSIESIPWHWHKELEFMYIGSGNALVECAGKRVVLQAGDGFFCNSKVLHRYHMEGKSCQVCYLVFDEKLISGGMGTIYYQKYINPIVSDTGFSGKFLYYKNKQDREAIKKIQAAYLAAKKEPVGFEYDIRFYLSKALLFLGHQLKVPEKIYTNSKMDRIKEMLDYVHSHYSEVIPIEKMALQAGISEREAQRSFKAVFQMSPRQYIQNYRLQVAEEMLLETSDSILSIGLACGFSNPSHFSKAFRQYRGCSPHVFRHRNLHGSE